jgi:hypothetical protein
VRRGRREGRHVVPYDEMKEDERSNGQVADGRHRQEECETEETEEEDAIWKRIGLNVSRKRLSRFDRENDKG